MITVNGEEHPWSEGLTVSRLLAEKNYTYPSIVVTVNGVAVPEEAFAVTPVADGDTVKAIHLVAGG